MAYLTIPGADFSASPNRLRTAVIDPDGNYLSKIPSLVTWFRADDVKSSGGLVDWKDRKGLLKLTPDSAPVNPIVATVGGPKAVVFDGTKRLRGPASLQLLNNFTLIYVLQPSAGFGDGMLSGGFHSSGNGLQVYMLGNGAFQGQVRAGQAGSLAGVFAASVSVIAAMSWDGTTLRFSKNGGAPTSIVPTTPGATVATTELLIGAYYGQNFTRMSLFDLMQFNVDLLGNSNQALDYSRVIARMKARYGIA